MARIEHFDTTAKLKELARMLHAEEEKTKELSEILRVAMEWTKASKMAGVSYTEVAAVSSYLDKVSKAYGEELKKTTAASEALDTDTTTPASKKETKEKMKETKKKVKELFDKEVYGDFAAEIRDKAAVPSAALAARSVDPTTAVEDMHTVISAHRSHSPSDANSMMFLNQLDFPSVPQIYRAKSIPSIYDPVSTWVVGFFWPFDDTVSALYDLSTPGVSTPIISSTLTRFTGMFDSENNPLYENDVVLARYYDPIAEKTVTLKCIIRYGLHPARSKYFDPDNESKELEYSLDQPVYVNGFYLFARYKDKTYSGDAAIVERCFDLASMLRNKDMDDEYIKVVKPKVPEAMFRYVHLLGNIYDGQIFDSATHEPLGTGKIAQLYHKCYNNDYMQVLREKYIRNRAEDAAAYSRFLHSFDCDEDGEDESEEGG